MSRLNLLSALAVFAGIFGAISFVGAIAIQNIPPVQQVSTPINGILLMVAAWFLWQRKHVASMLFAISAAVYILSYAVPAIAVHGLDGLASFMPAFYLSVGSRVGLAVLAHWLLKSRFSNV